MKNELKRLLIKMGFDKKSLRLLLDKKTLKKLPIKYCKNKRPIYKAMTSWFYNPVSYYADKIRPKKGECGHDDKFRYILK